AQARPGDLQGGLQPRGRPVRGGGSRPRHGLERGREQVREERRGQLGAEV
ncbi:MAG: Cation transport regulator chaB, partial [uncultured Rubrobacteraceae bacterium]